MQGGVEAGRPSGAYCLVKVHFPCPLDWAQGCRDSWQTSLSMCTSMPLDERSLSLGGLRKTTLSDAGGHHPSAEGLEGTEGRRRTSVLFLLELGQPPPPALGQQRSWFLALWT